MARRSRLRNKLLLGLGLVVGSVLLLLTGTMQALTSYVSTMNTAESKTAELMLLDELKPIVSAMVFAPQADPADPTATVKPGQFSPPDEPRRVAAKLAQARERFQAYKHRFADTLAHKYDPDPYLDQKLIEKIDASFGKLGIALENRKKRADFADAGLSADVAVMGEYNSLLGLIDQLRSEVASDIYRKVQRARSHYVQSLWTVGIAVGLAGMLLLSVAVLFRTWVFAPIRKIQEGVERVTAGEFTQPIQLKSGDELELLADAFNAMTERVKTVQDDLTRQVDERSRQLVRSERMVSVGFLAAGVAHEINNPLASIMLGGDGLAARLEPYIAQNPADVKIITGYLQLIRKEAARCKTITMKLLDFSRVGEPKREPTDLGELVQSVLEVAQLLQNCRGKRMLFSPLERVIAGVNAPDLKSVVLNLVVNGLDSMTEGGTLTIGLRTDGPDAVLTFRDDGCGMSDDVKKNLFEPFFTKSRTGKGTGLGLFICNQIIDAHGGEIRAESVGLNHGSTFTVRVPIQPAGRQTASSEANLLPFGAPRPANPTTEDGLGYAA